MARKQRVHYPGAIYHVMVRGNNKEDIFQDEEQKIKYIDTIVEYKEKLDFHILAYCIMDNHAHIIIKVKETPLSQIMQRIQQVYTQWFNWRYNRTGHVFQQRYKALLCTRDSYLLQLVKYIHENPVKANLDGGLQYKWSSHTFYISGREDAFISMEFVLSMFSSRKGQAVYKYLEFMKEPQGEIKYLDPEELLKGINEEILSLGKKEIEIDIDKILEDISKNEGVGIDIIISKTKVQRITDIRKAIVLLSHKYTKMQKKDIADKLNLPQSMVSKIISGAFKDKIYVEEIIQRWEGIRE